jgi:hypothetical protein
MRRYYRLSRHCSGFTHRMYKGPILFYGLPFLSIIQSSQNFPVCNHFVIRHCIAVLANAVEVLKIGSRAFTIRIACFALVVIMADPMPSMDHGS